MINFVTQSAYFFLKKICWDFIYYQIHCFEYIINLVIQSFLFSDSTENSDENSNEEKKAKQIHKKTYQKMKFHKKLHNNIIHIHDLKTCTRNFKHLTERTISHDNSIR